MNTASFNVPYPYTIEFSGGGALDVQYYWVNKITKQRSKNFTSLRQTIIELENHLSSK